VLETPSAVGHVESNRELDRGVAAGSCGLRRGLRTALAQSAIVSQRVTRSRPASFEA
jgi:hypothetical protein